MTGDASRGPPTRHTSRPGWEAELAHRDANAGHRRRSRPAQRSCAATRRLSLAQTPLLAVLIVVGLVAHFPAWLWIIFGVFLVLVIGNLVVMTVRIGRFERAERAGSLS